MSNVFSRYGHNWPGGMNEEAVELRCFRKIGIIEGFQTGHTRSYHFEKALRLILPEKTPDGRPGYVMSRWSEKRIQSLCDSTRNFQTWWGSAGSGKSTDAAAFLIVYFCSAPDVTAIQVCSTTKSALMKRIWSELVRFYQFRSPNTWPMEYFRGKPAFQYKIPGSKSCSEKSGIFGRALLRGSVEEAVGEIQGLHNEFNVLMIDELAVSRWAGVEAFDNLNTGREAIFLGCGNPVRRLDPLGLASKPKNGWNSISSNLEEWETEKGYCLYFDGLKSPGIDDPKKYWFLTTQKQIDSMRKDPGENTPRFWTMARGFMPPEGLTQSVFSEALIQRYDLQRKEPHWSEAPITIAALDGAFSLDGDRCVLVTAKIGRTIKGVPTIHFDKTLVINIEMNEGEPLEYFIVRRVREYCMSQGIPAVYFGLDVTASQSSLASIFDREWGSGVYRCQFGGAAIGERISKDDPRPAKDVYHNRVSELWYDVRTFAINGQVSGLSDDACREACSRITIEKGAKVAVESKEEMKKRTGESPDIFDGHAILVALAVDRFHMRPGEDIMGEQAGEISESVLKELEEAESEDNAYTGDPVPDDELDIIESV